MPVVQRAYIYIYILCVQVQGWVFVSAYEDMLVKRSAQ